MTRVAVLPGDGIGREVVPAAVEVLADLGLGLEFESFDVGAERFLATGQALPDGEFADVCAADAVLLGAIGDPRISDPRYTAQVLTRLRSGLDVYANVRPARLFADRLTPLRAVERAQVDLVVVRENTEGLYAGVGGRFRRGTPEEVAIQHHVNTARGVERVLEYAFRTARRAVCMVDKWNAMPDAGGLWQERFRAVASRHPSIAAEHLMIDAACLHLVRHPAQFDVVVTENCFGDILSDLAAELAGGLGVAPSANLNPETGRGLFEPVHGSAPDIAGQGIANPAAAILTGALLLRHLGFAEEAAGVEAAVASAIRDGECTRDLGGSLSTAEAAQVVRRRVGWAVPGRR